MEILGPERSAGVKLMPGKQESSRNGSRVLKTTTWGAVIALSAAILVTGLVGLNPLTKSGEFGRPAAQVAEKALPSSGPSLTPALQGSFNGGDVREDQPVLGKALPSASETVSDSSVSTVASPIRSSQAELSQPNPPSESNGGGSGSANSVEAQRAVLAKIAPDLKGLDPEAPVDVIVQFKTAAGVSDVAADGATAKADLSLVKAELVTVKGGSLPTLAAHSSVAYISPDRTVKGSLEHVVTAVNAD